VAKTTPKPPKASLEERKKRVYKGVKRAYRDDTADNLGPAPKGIYATEEERRIERKLLEATSGTRLGERLKKTKKS
jgi:hypothetical protein